MEEALDLSSYRILNDDDDDVSACTLKVNFTIEHVKKVQRGNTIIALLFL